MLNEAEVILIAWGSWVRSGSNGAWPKSSIIARLIEEGSGAAHSTAMRMPAMPPSVEIAEQAVLRMPKTLRRVAMHYWVGQEPAGIIRQKLKIGTRELDERINEVVHYVANFIVEN